MAITYDEGMEPKRKRKKANGKAVGASVGCAVAIAAVVGLAFLGVSTYRKQEALRPRGYETPEEAAEAAVGHMLDGDGASIVRMMPEALRSRVITDVQTTYGIADDDAEGLKRRMYATLSGYASMLDGVNGGDRENSVGSPEVTVYDEEALKDYNFQLKVTGVADWSADGAAVAKVPYGISSSFGASWSGDVAVPLVQADGKWYFGQGVGTTYAEVARGLPDVFGELGDGFHMDGEYDSDGNKVIRNEEGYRIVFGEKEAYYDDLYGNRHYLDGDLAETRVEGPDGGEPLTEETYPEWLERKQAEWEAEHPEAAGQDTVHADMVTDGTD